MANKTTAMDSFMKEGCVRLMSGDTLVFPDYEGLEGTVHTGWASKFNGCYAVNNSTIAFVCDDEFYVTPYTKAAIQTLQEAGYSVNSFYVPLSNGDYPKAQKNKWQYLRMLAEISYKEDFLSDCADYCDKHQIGILSDETLKKCVQMPEKGVEVVWHDATTRHYPVVSGKCFDSSVAVRVGKYCANNGRVLFVYRDGRTYVTKGYAILEELRSAGYKEDRIFVPFSNGEEIVDVQFKAEWESIKK